MKLQIKVITLWMTLCTFYLLSWSTTIMEILIIASLRNLLGGHLQPVSPSDPSPSYHAGFIAGPALCIKISSASLCTALLIFKFPHKLLLPDISLFVRGRQAYCGSSSKHHELKPGHSFRPGFSGDTLCLSSVLSSSFINEQGLFSCYFLLRVQFDPVSTDPKNKTPKVMEIWRPLCYDRVFGSFGGMGFFRPQAHQINGRIRRRKTSKTKKHSWNSYLRQTAESLIKNRRRPW